MGVNFLHQLLHARSVLLIFDIGRILSGGKRLWKGYLLGIPQWRVSWHSHSLKGSHPLLLEPVLPSLINDQHHRPLDIRKTHVVPFVLIGFKGYL